MAQAAAASSGRNERAQAFQTPQIPREYNFAADILESNLAAGRANAT